MQHTLYKFGFNKPIHSKFRNHALPPNYTTEDMKEKETSAIFKKRNSAMPQLKQDKPSNTSYSSFHPTSLTNFQLSTKSCVNTKGAELEVILSSSNNDILQKTTDKEDVAMDYWETMILPTKPNHCHINTENGTRHMTNRPFSKLNNCKTSAVPPISYRPSISENEGRKSNFCAKVQ